MSESKVLSELEISETKMAARAITAFLGFLLITYWMLAIFKVYT